MTSAIPCERCNSDSTTLAESDTADDIRVRTFECRDCGRVFQEVAL